MTKAEKRIGDCLGWLVTGIMYYLYFGWTIYKKLSSYKIKIIKDQK